MKIYHNKKSQILIVTALIVSVATTLFGATQSFYPNIYETPQLSSANKTLLDTKELETFLSTWKIDGMQLIEDVENQIEQHSKALQSLQSVVRIQDAQVEQAKRERLPKISFVNTPTAPLYGYSTFTSDSVPVTVTTHSFSLATGITQKLPTAGTLDLSLSNVSSYSTANGGTDWTWKQTPSATLSISQPLFINEKVVDGTLASKALEKVELQQEESFEALLATGESLTKQGVALLHTYQNLYENRWLLYKEAYLSEQALEDSKESLTAGLVSENQLVGQRNTYQQLLIQLQSLENEIAALGSSLEQLGFQEPFTPPQIDIEDITFVLSYKGSALLDNEDNLAMALEHDSDYQSALRTLKTAQLDAALGNGSDAPIFKVSMSYSPYYSSTTGNSFGESFTDLFSSSTKNNVSVFGLSYCHRPLSIFIENN